VPRSGACGTSGNGLRGSGPRSSTGGRPWRRDSRGCSGWRLLGCGAYFAYAEHPFADASDVIARRLVHEAGVLMLPGTMFTPEGSAEGARQMRIAFANVDRAGIGRLVDRLAAVAP
jgi:aspartate/methionine/tyrosine aminotransferase